MHGGRSIWKGKKRKRKRGSFRITRKPISLVFLMSHELDSLTFLIGDGAMAREKERCSGSTIIALSLRPGNVTLNQCISNRHSWWSSTQCRYMLLCMYVFKRRSALITDVLIMCVCELVDDIITEASIIAWAFLTYNHLPRYVKSCQTVYMWFTVVVLVLMQLALHAPTHSNHHTITTLFHVIRCHCACTHTL